MARFRIVGEFADLMKEGNIVAIRNGKSDVVDEHIILQIDRFGKISLEPEVKIESVEDKVDISSQRWEKKKRNY